MSEGRPPATLTVAALAVWASLPGGAGAVDAMRGADVWRSQCAMCHEVGPEAEHWVGPHLNDILGRPLGGLEDFTGYSGGLVLMGIDGAVWDAALLRDFLHEPYALLAGTKMRYGGLRAAEDLDDLMAWLVPASRGKLPPVEGFRLDAAVLSREGDLEYGAHLAAECTTCHRRDGGADGIPSITGWPEGVFVTVMHAYRAGVRPNVTMQTITKRLGEEEIAALAAYFATLERPLN